MNYLAHIYLNGDDPELQVGGFIGDFVKGDLTGKFPYGIEQGIRLHRHIDKISDHLNAFKRSKSRIRPEWSRFSGIFIDIIYDHFLARHWLEFHHLELKSFSRNFMNELLRHDPYIPDGARPFINYMKIHQLFDYYVEIDQIENVLYGMSRRFKRENPLAKGIADLRLHYDKFQKDFFDFIPDIKSSLASIDLNK